MNGTISARSLALLIGQLLSAIVHYGERSDTWAWRGMEMFLKHQVSADATELIEYGAIGSVRTADTPLLGNRVDRYGCERSCLTVSLTPPLAPKG